MFNYKLKNFGLLLAFVVIAMSSCTPDDSVTINETEEPIELGLKMTVNGVALQADSYAAYCETDSSQFYIIANKTENLEFPFDTQNFEEDDYVYMLDSSGKTTTWGYGGQALGESVTGLDGILSVLFSDAVINITSHENEIVAGSASGTLYGTDGAGGWSTYPYAMEFVAEIVAQSDYCD